MEIDHVVTPIGDTVEIKPERLVLFFLDQPTALAAYAADPEYTALAPLRDNGLASYDLFFGEDPSGANPSEISEMGL